MIAVVLLADRVTKNTIRFQEVLADPAFDVPHVGTVYIPKRTLQTLGWKDGTMLELTVGVKQS
jgi:hypothetical protein